MSRNNYTFDSNPTRLDMSRSKFNMNFDVKTSFNVGDIIPIAPPIEVLPGDTFKVNKNAVIRMQPMVAPIMDNIYFDTYHFFVPNRLVWNHWKEFMGENTQSAWIPETVYSIPQLSAPDGGWNVGTIADYFGIPTGISDFSVNALPFRAYALIMNEWFRDENLTNPIDIPKDDSAVAGVNTGNRVTDVAKGGLPYKAAKYHDYFTSCLPGPQKGDDVTISLGGTMPVVPRNVNIDSSLFDGSLIRAVNPDGTALVSTFSDSSGLSFTADGRSVKGVNYSAGSQIPFSPSGSSSSVSIDTPASTPVFSNLYAIGDQASAISINQLRIAFQMQKFLERDARGGTRYIEMIKSHFGVQSPDARLQRPEYLGGSRVPVQIQQIIQTSETGSTPQGTPTGFSQTADSNHDFTKSFVEHGYIISVGVCRYKHSYQQGLNRMWSRLIRTDFYFPTFANIGEQPVKNKEIYLQSDTVVDDAGEVVNDKVFGYNEAWADYRYRPDTITGEMRSTYQRSLDVWHLGDEYASLPSLNDTWIQEDKANVDRTLVVQSDTQNQLWADFFYNIKAIRPLPLYSVPGLIDHH